ncbi:MAG TPA: UDP-3-O-acyl-N-acetylglucosamine deacetylase [Abditibacteriaceae bacterium]|jgi:UDP-3-O-[3-hydroxymyristoyl] N-acetylglucosamine deacetylase
MTSLFTSSNPSIPFRTLAKPVSLRGIGLHTGVEVAVELCPSDTCGLVFVRADLDGEPEIPAALSSVTTTTHATTLAKNGCTLSTTEHLLAALWITGITHCRIRIHGPEIPILDGSAGGWIELLHTAGSHELSGARPVYTLREPVWIEAQGASVLGLPHDAFRLSVAVSYDRPFLSPQSCDFDVTPEVFATEIAPARTFTLEEWLQPLRSAGLIRGGSTDNAIVLSENGPSSPYHFTDELARHKALDVLGDFALMFAPDGGLLHAHIVAIRAGHGPHRAWMERCLETDALYSRR